MASYLVAHRVDVGALVEELVNHFKPAAVRRVVERSTAILRWRSGAGAGTGARAEAKHAV
jgi:hypothetical protein